MRNTYPKQFWIWFQRTSDILLTGNKMKKKELDYWVREVEVHLRAYSKRLTYAIVWKDNTMPKLVISTRARPKFFSMAEKFVALAAAIKDWEVIALHPPGLLDFAYLQHKALEAGIDLSKCWFEPPTGNSEDREVLYVYAEVYTSITDKMEKAVNDYVWNLIGEKVYGNEVEYVCLHSIYTEFDEEEQAERIPLHKLPEYVILRERADFFIGEDGALKEKAHDRPL